MYLPTCYASLLERGARISGVDAIEFLRKAGKKGGQARAKKMTAEQRKKSARDAAQARWAKQKKEPK